MKEDESTINLEGLDKLIKALKVKAPVIRVGILSGSSQRSSTAANTPTNAEIGAAHEFGAPARGLPERSFLRMPLSRFLVKRMEAAGALDRETLKAIIKQGSLTPWLKKVAVLAEAVVQDAFDSGGFGEWPQWKKGYTSKTGTLLVDTGQLRDSITSEVKE